LGGGNDGNPSVYNLCLPNWGTGFFVASRQSGVRRQKMDYYLMKSASESALTSRRTSAALYCNVRQFGIETGQIDISGCASSVPRGIRFTS
jgi:hypothetical protein